eukprot:1130006-Amphidinium_carterae.1
MGFAAEAVTTWETALVEGAPQLEAADQILRGSWLIDLPIVPMVDEDGEAIKSFSEVKVFGLHWTGRPMTPADQILVALHLFAVTQGDGQECEVPLYQMGTTEALEVRMLVLPAHYLIRRLRCFARSMRNLRLFHFVYHYVHGGASVLGG